VLHVEFRRTKREQTLYSTQPKKERHSHKNQYNREPAANVSETSQVLRYEGNEPKG